MLLQNDNDHEIHFGADKPIAQILFIPVSSPAVKQVRQAEMSQTTRGQGGFGSTDKKTVDGYAADCSKAKCASIAKIVHPRERQMYDLKRGDIRGALRLGKSP